MKSSMKTCFYLVVSLFLLSACAHPERAYRTSRNGHKLVVKPPLTRRLIDNTFVLPNVGKFVPQTTKPPK